MSLFRIEEEPAQIEDDGLCRLRVGPALATSARIPAALCTVCAERAEDVPLLCPLSWLCAYVGATYLLTSYAVSSGGRKGLGIFKRMRTAGTVRGRGRASNPDSPYNRCW